MDDSLTDMIAYHDLLERAAIIEFDGGLPREEAEAEAARQFGGATLDDAKRAIRLARAGISR